MICFMSLLPMRVDAQVKGETLIEFFTTNATMEDNPKKQNYNITLFSPDGQWKMQLNYNSESMFGTFGNDDFNLSGDGRYYNFVRNPNNDMVFYSFTDMQVEVTDEVTQYRVKANCLTNTRLRFVVEATIDCPQPAIVRTDDLGYARVEENPFYETFAIHAENDNFKLSYGIVGKELQGTFYRADMLMPELYDKRTGRDINIVNATATHTKDGDNTQMKVELLGDDRVLYRLSMFTGKYNVMVVREVDVNINSATIQDLTQMYGCYLFVGANEKYQMGIALRPESVENGRTEWTKDDLNMQYTRLYLVEEDEQAEIFDVKVKLDETDKAMLVKADVTTMDGTLYHVTMLVEGDGYMPEATDTVNIDFGHVKMLDYTQGLGIIGFGAMLLDQYQIRAYVNAPKLEGEFTTGDFDLDRCDVMVVTGNTYVFHDAKYVNAKMEKQGERTLITLDMYGVDEVLYHATMYIDPMKCMQEESDYAISYDDDVVMMAMRDGNVSYGEYTLQLQNLDNTFDEDDRIVGDGYYFSFYFAHEGNGVSGMYGYSDGTLADDEYHGFYENGCEVRVAPVAGTLKVEPLQKVNVNVGFPIGNIITYAYQISFQFVGQNACIYRGKGDNLLMCIDMDGNILKLDEDKALVDSIKEQLADQGLKVRKVLRGGKIIVERADKAFDLSGRAISAGR